MNTYYAARDLNPGRRGMLLLMVLCMLTLFLLMGTLAIVMATRARESARAFATVISGPNQLSITARAATDEALLTLLRGSNDSKVKAEVTESLLKDMYGTGTNGKFVDEAYDAFDDDNPFLTRLALTGSGQGTGQVSAAARPAFQKTGSNALPCDVDNDSDGIPDGVWLTNVLPSVTLPDGGELTFRVSYLVLDLDSRINVNAHGRRADDPRESTAPEGPGDIDGSAVVGGTTSWLLVLGGTGGQLPASGTAASSLQWRPAPTLTNQPVDGRFASAASKKTYDLRLDLEGLRPSMLASSTGQNPFTLGELERVLRQFDSDAHELPPRLAAILGDNAERSRMRITTDSWDTPNSRIDIQLEAANSGVTEEKEVWNTLCDAIMKVFVPKDPKPTVTEVQQWVANVLDFRDKDAAQTNFGGGVKGSEPDGTIPGPWNTGIFSSYAILLAVPEGKPEDWQAKRDATPPQPVISLAKRYPKILEAVRVPSPFTSTITADPTREPGRVNVNTCDDSVWRAMLGTSDTNPFAPDKPPAKNSGELLLINAVSPDGTFDVTTINSSVANRIATAATVRSHVFAIWITVEITSTSATGTTPSCYRLFAIIDRSIPVTYAEGQNNNVRDLIRLQRFLN